MYSTQIALVVMALAGSLGTGLAQAQGADVQWSVTIGSPAGVPVHAVPMPTARPAPVHLPQGY